MQSQDDKVPDTLLKMLQYEAEQLDRRLTWLGTFQGFLFAALAFAWEKDRSVILILASTGVLVAFLILFGLVAGIVAVTRIRKYWFDHRPPEYDGPYHPVLRPWHPRGLAPHFYLPAETLIPVVFIAAWVFVLLITLGV